jgi:hypothetical protein
VLAIDPPLAGGESTVGATAQDDIGDRVECARRQRLGARDEIACRIVDETVERTVAPYLLEHGVDLIRETDVANEIRGFAAGLRPLRYTPFEHLLASPADHDLRAKLDEAGAQALADACPAAGDENRLPFEHFL